MVMCANMLLYRMFKIFGLKHLEAGLAHACSPDRSGFEDWQGTQQLAALPVMKAAPVR